MSKVSKFKNLTKKKSEEEPQGKAAKQMLFAETNTSKVKNDHNDMDTSIINDDDKSNNTNISTIINTDKNNDTSIDTSKDNVTVNDEDIINDNVINNDKNDGNGIIAIIGNDIDENTSNVTDIITDEDNSNVISVDNDNITGNNTSISTSVDTDTTKGLPKVETEEKKYVSLYLTKDLAERFDKFVRNQIKKQKLKSNVKIKSFYGEIAIEEFLKKYGD